MSDFHHDHALPRLEADEFVLDTPFLRGFIAEVHETIPARLGVLEAVVQNAAGLAD
jgi:hypothetical protein